MRVKKLEVCGFKSFAQKTTVHFEPGVTAIVGPNGSGKSNLVDAIRWVLGEHNPRDVRAPRLEDVIFNGTDHKAPVSMAEVHLTIANEQGLLPIAFTEVTITRRVYRSGESECLINQSPCRLKDIQELFLGTGLGGGTYAIIEQGHIDLILSSKPEERRVVFEEASGVAKYLAKKQETTRRLDEVEEHLVRIADIIGEVRRQVGALERSANKARQYQARWEQLKGLELRLAVDELCAGRHRTQELEGQLAALQAQRETLETQKQQRLTSLESCNAAVSAIQQQLQGSRTRVVECTSQIDQHEGQCTLKTSWMEGLTTQIRQLESEDTHLRARLTQLDEQLARVGGGETELRAQLDTVTAQLEQGSSELAALEEIVRTSTDTANAAKAQLFEAATSASAQRNQLAELTTRLNGVEAHLVRLEERRQEREARVQDVQQRRETAHQQREAQRLQHEELQQCMASAQHALDEASARRHELTGRLHQLREQLASERAHVKLLEDLWRRYEGFPETVKTLMGHGIDGLIGPLVDVVQAVPGHEDIVEAALGPLAEALIVRDRQAMARCRELLTARQLEGCRFLVLSDCPAGPIAVEEPATMAGLTGSVKQYVQTEPTYQPLVDWLLNDSWVIDDLERLLGEGSVPQHRFVSAQGDRWDRRAWRFRGARNAAEQSRIGRRQRWEHAQAYLQLLEEQVARVERDATLAEHEWQSLQSSLESARAQVTQLAPSLHALEAQLGQWAHEARQLEEDQRSRELETQELTQQRTTLQAELATSRQAVEEAESRQQAIERSLAEAHATRENAEQRRGQWLIAKAQVEATIQSLTERLQALQTRAQEIDSERLHVTQQIEAKTLQRQEAMTRSQELTQQLKAHHQAMAQLREEHQRLEAEVAEVALRLQREEATRNELLPHLLAAEQQLSSLAQQIQEQRQQLSERTLRRSHLVERLQELYHIDEATLAAEERANPAPLTEEQRTQMTQEVQALRAKLEGLGPVSLGSVEEYDGLKRRLEFLQTQQQDLIQARDDLKTSITQINRAARSQFRETFQRIQQEFQHYYTRLFNGGQADLILMDEEDVLECGIDIVARPPGKRLQNISLLSGGERALTAVSLLFALFKVRPSPFCVLDEIDAPLDEANVDRFTNVLEEFLSLSQFILITHNKKTITKADSLYGVTMEEPGISKILSAKLTKPAEPPAPTAPLAEVLPPS